MEIKALILKYALYYSYFTRIDLRFVFFSETISRFNFRLKSLYNSTAIFKTRSWVSQICSFVEELNVIIFKTEALKC